MSPSKSADSRIDRRGRARRDVERCYALHANVYLRKPLSFSALRGIVGAIDAFWLGLARLPPRAHPAG